VATSRTIKIGETIAIIMRAATITQVGEMVMVLTERNLMPMELVEAIPIITTIITSPMAIMKSLSLI